MPKVKKIDPALPFALWAALGLALVIRIAYLFFSKDGPFYEPVILDPVYYHKWALKIVGGDWKGEDVFYGLPLYPFFLALVYKITNQSLLAVKFLQACLGVATVFLTYKIGEKIHSKNVGVLAALFAAFYGPLFFHEQILTPESLGVPLYALSFYLACLFSDSPTVKKGIGLGVCSALAALTKAGLIPFVLLLPFLFYLNHRRQSFSVKPWAAYLLVFFLTLSPVAIHNWVYGHDFVPLTSHGGFNFYIGNNPKAEGVFVAPEGTGSNVDAQIADSKAVAEREEGRSLKPSEVSKFWSDKAWRYISENPMSFVRLSLIKFVLFFDAREISDVEDYSFAKNFNPMLRLPWLNFSVIGPLFVLGILAAFGKMKYRLYLTAWILLYVTAIVFFFVNARYRLPVLSVFFPVAAVGLLEIVEAIKKKTWLRLLLCAGLLGLGIWLTQAQLVGNNWLKDYINAGDAYQEKQEYERAEGLYKRALEIDPDAPKANLAMGVLMTRFEKHDEAKIYYEKSLAHDPDNSQALNNLGMWYERRGEFERAKDHFLKAIQAKPNFPQAYNNLGMVYAKMGENERAVQAFQTSLSFNPASPRANTNLGLIYHRLGEKAKAREYWEKALQIDPSFREAKKALELLEK